MVIDPLASIYHRFLVSENVQPSRFRSELVYHSSANSSSHQAELILDDVAQMLENNLHSDAVVYEMVLQTLLRRVRSHYLIHAG